MLGFIIGTLCLVGLIKVLRHGHAYGPGFGHGYGGYGWGARRWGGCGGHGGCGGGFGHHDHCGHDRDRGRDFGELRDFGGPGPGFGPRAFVRGLFERLDTTPGQEKVILQAIDEVREAMRGAKHELGKSRVEIAQAFGREHFDAETMGGVFSRHDDAIATVRKAFVGALSRVHEALDERQRRVLAELIETRMGGFGGRGFWRGGRW